MATVTTPVRSRNLVEAHQRVRSPLERLRSFIRLYVGLEGAAIVGLFLALWFWIGLALDYGVFRLFHIDWVQEWPWGVRCALLVLILSGLAAAVAVKVVTRLFREFRDSALALVLERRFPNILGDRLITAVELADPKKAAEVGYSPVMVQETIHEAAQRVEQLKIKEVFDWRRLTRSGILIGVLVVAGYLLVGLGFCGINAIQGHGFALAGFSQFHEVAGIWFERNVLLHNVIWPRQAHLEYLDPPANGEYRIGKGERGPTIRVRALKFVIAGAPTKKAVENYRAWLDSRGVGGDEQEALVGEFKKKPIEGWRALSWFDLTPDLLGAPVPQIPLPTDWKIREERAGLSLDEIELNLDKPETHKTLAAEAKEGMRGVLELLEDRATDPALSRVLRKLSIPDEALLIYKGNTTNSQTTMQRLADNEYTGQFGDLKETVTYYVKGLDYYTAPHKVVVVDPPVLDDLVRVEERPAYLYYRLRKDDNPDLLSGKKQIFLESKVSLQGGEVSRIDVPAGTNVTLTAAASKDLRSVKIEPHKSHKAGVPLIGSPPQMLDSRTFRTRFDNLRFEQNFVFRFTDTDGVSGQRQVVILPMEDAPPKVRELAPDETVRKVQGGFMTTVSARIPFKGQVDDDHGLTDVRYAYTIAQSESARVNRRASHPVLGIASLAPNGQGLLPGLIDLAFTVHEADAKTEKKTEPAVVEYFALPSFKKALEGRPEDAFQHPDTVREELVKPKKEPYRQLLRNFKLEADKWTQPDLDPIGCDLPLWKIKPGLKMTDPSRPQPRYQMQIWLEAVDTDLDSDKDKDGKPQPHVKVSEEKFTIFLVSENELLTEIAKEEEKLHTDLNQKYDDLLETQVKLVRVGQDLSSASVKEVELGAMSARTDQVSEVLEKGQNLAREVHTAYDRILREMKANQVSEKFTERVEKSIVKPLKSIDSTFDKTRGSVNDFRTALDNKDAALPERVAASRKTGDTAKEQMRVLMVELDKILAAMMKMKGINDLVKMIAEIERTEAEQFDTIKGIKDKLEDAILGEALESDKPDKKK